MLCSFLLLTNFIYADTLSSDEIHGEAAIIVDYKTGEILWEKDAHVKKYPASTTKIMTAIIILENHDLDEEVLISSTFQSPGGSSMAIDHGEIFTVEQLMYALLVKSANDAAKALAEFHSGTEEAFAKEMNAKAIELGAKDTNFVNAHGLHNANHYTTAYDLAVIGKYAYNLPIFKTMVNTTHYIIPPTNKKDEPRDYLYSSNKFLNGFGRDNQMIYKGQTIDIKYDIVDGMKTGYTNEASYCLVSTAEKNNERYLVVVLKALNSDHLYLDSRTLLDYAFDNFIRHQFISKGSFVETIQLKGEKKLRVNLVAAKSFTLTLDKDTDLTKIQTETIYNKNISAPLKAGTELGKITYYYDNKPLGVVSLVSEYDVNESNLVTSIETALIKRTSDNKVDLKFYIGVLLRLLIAFIIYRSIVTYWLLRKKKKDILETKA